jgi:S-DNA-T family DNA segregation ATPase FtsK/SpoIIIE
MDAPEAQEMAVLKNSTTQITDWRQKLQYRLKEGALIALGAMCLYVLMALLTYNVADPAWDNSVQVERIINAGGSIGAWLSSALFGALGYFAYIFPLHWLGFPDSFRFRAG